eukprot:s5034_g5.t1
MDIDNLKFEMIQAENKFKMEISDRNAQIKRMESENEDLKMVEKQLRREKDAATVHENGLQDVIVSLKDENVEIMAKNDSLRSRVTELLHRKMDEDAPSPYRQICDELREELMKTQEELRVRSEAVASNPILGEAILNLELDDAEKAKRMYEEVVKERDEVIRKNLQLYVDLQEANKRLSSSSAAPVVPVPLSPALLPPTSLCPLPAMPKAGTPSFAAAEAANGSTPKASSVKNLPLPPPPMASLDAVEDVLGFTTQSHQQVTSVVRPEEYAKLREELAAAEACSTRHYEEMKEYKSWLAQVEDEAYAAGQPDPVPDNPPGLWDQHEGSNVERESQVPDFREWVTRISRKEHEKVTLKPWPKCNDLDVWRSNVVQAVCVASGDPDTASWREWLAPAQVPKPDYTLLSDSGDYRFQSIDSKLSMALQNLVENAGEVAYDVKVQIRQRSQELGKKGNFIMGREIFAMILDHFRTTSRDEVLFNASHIYKLQYRGDKEMDKFLNAWLEIIANMKPEDIPSDVVQKQIGIYKGQEQDVLSLPLQQRRM